MIIATCLVPVSWWGGAICWRTGVRPWRRGHHVEQSFRSLHPVGQRSCACALGSRNFCSLWRGWLSNYGSAVAPCYSCGPKCLCCLFDANVSRHQNETRVFAAGQGLSCCDDWPWMICLQFNKHRLSQSATSHTLTQDALGTNAMLMAKDPGVMDAKDVGFDGPRFGSC